MNRETWAAFIHRLNIDPELLNDPAALIYYSSIYCHEQKLNNRRHIMMIRKTLDKYKRKNVRFTHIFNIFNNLFGQHN